MKAHIPSRWSAYACEDYFAEGWWERGYFDEPSQTLVIVSLGEVHEEAEFEFLAIGRSGSDGIDFGYRRDHTGLWAFYPIDCDFKFMAPTVAALVQGWCSGELSV